MFDVFQAVGSISGGDDVLLLLRQLSLSDASRACGLAHGRSPRFLLVAESGSSLEPYWKALICSIQFVQNPHRTLSLHGISMSRDGARHPVLLSGCRAAIPDWRRRLHPLVVARRIHPMNTGRNSKTRALA